MAKKKRGNGEGSIYRRKDGRWVGQYAVRTPEGREYRYIYGKTRKAVAGKLTKAMADRDGGIVLDAGNLNVEQYLERWLEDSVRDTVRPTTYESYRWLAGSIHRSTESADSRKPTPKGGASVGRLYRVLLYPRVRDRVEA